MADTLVDEPPPPTVRDDTLAAAIEAEPPRVEVEPPLPELPTKGRARGRIALVLLASILTVLAGAGVALYLFVWRYEPRAHLHVPGNATVAFRIDAPRLALYGPVRKHLWPLLFTPREQAKGKSLSTRIDDATGVDLEGARELLIATVDTSSWVAIVGGKIAPSRLVAGLAKLARDEGWPGNFHVEGELLVGAGGLAIGQADDGVIAVGTDKNIVTAALPGGAEREAARLALDEREPISFAITREAWSGASTLAAVAHASVLGRIDRASGRLSLGDAPELVMHIYPAQQATPAELARDLEIVLGELKLVSLLRADVAGEQGALAAAKVRAEGDHVIVSAPWSPEALERGCERLATTLQALEKAP